MRSEAADVCVVGAGPAGLVVAGQLAEHGIDVVLLESGLDGSSDGGLDSGSMRDLNRAEVRGDRINALDLVATRTRRVGGAANQWLVKIDRGAGGWTYGVRYGTLTDTALAERPWLGCTGWPVGAAELEPWYRRAHDLLALGPFDYDDPPPQGPQTSWLGAELITCRSFRFGPRDRVLVDLRREVESHRRISVITGATVTGLHQPRPGGPVERLGYVDPEGRANELRVATVVLAGGGVENARLLLASAADRGGIGNETDNVGRYFMDHPLFSIGDVGLSSEDRLRDFTFFDLAPDGGGHDPRHGHVVTSRSWCERHEAVEVAAAFFPRPARPVVESIETAKWLLRNARRLGTRPRELVPAIARIGPGLRALPWMARVSLREKQSLLPGFGRGGWSSDPTGLGFTELEVVLQCEQPPLRDSRITLSGERDRLGTPLPRINWLLGERTRHSVLAFQRLIAERIEAAGIGTYRPRAGNLDELDPPTSIAHHLGTTRMSLRPQDGVVDRDCRVHTCPNLYIAGSSVFPSGGYVNPTLTIAALAMRLAASLARDRARLPDGGGQGPDGGS